MTREEYIDFANALKNNYTIDFDKLPEFCDMAISALSENKGEWIPVSERLPEEGHVVYCQLTDGSHEILFLYVYSDGQMNWVGRKNFITVFSDKIYCTSHPCYKGSPESSERISTTIK